MAGWPVFEAIHKRAFIDCIFSTRHIRSLPFTLQGKCLIALFISIQSAITAKLDMFEASSKVVLLRMTLKNFEIDGLEDM